MREEEASTAVDPREQLQRVLQVAAIEVPPTLIPEPASPPHSPTTTPSTPQASQSSQSVATERQPWSRTVKQARSRSTGMPAAASRINPDHELMFSLPYNPALVNNTVDRTPPSTPLPSSTTTPASDTRGFFAVRYVPDSPLPSSPSSSIAFMSGGGRSSGLPSTTPRSALPPPLPPKPNQRVPQGAMTTPPTPPHQPHPSHSQAVVVNSHPSDDEEDEDEDGDEEDDEDDEDDDDLPPRIAIPQQQQQQQQMQMMQNKNGVVIRPMRIESMAASKRRMQQGVVRSEA